MTNEERDLIAQFISRVGGAPQSGSFLGGGSVPQSQPALPPLDREADAFIGQQMRQYPEAAYRITQTAIVQEAAFAEAQNRIKRLEWELEQTRNAVQQAAQQAPQQQRGFLSGLFGGAQSQPQPQQQRPGGPFGGQPQGQPVWGQGYQPTSAPPQPQYPPNYQPGMFQRGGGSGFLGSALTTAAGVAGGMVVGNALMGAFSGHHGSDQASSSPWGGDSSNTSGSVFDNGGVVPTDPSTGFGTDTSYNDPFAGGGMQKDASLDTQSSWDQSGGGFDAGGGGGFDGGGGGGGGGFDDNNS